MAIGFLSLFQLAVGGAMELYQIVDDFSLSRFDEIFVFTLKEHSRLPLRFLPHFFLSRTNFSFHWRHSLFRLTNRFPRISYC